MATGREQGHADVVSAICSHDLDVGKLIAEGLIWRVYGPLRAPAGKNRVTAGWNLDFQVSAFCGDETELLSTPLQHLPVAVCDVDEPGDSVRDVTGVAKASNPNVKCCCTHDIPPLSRGSPRAHLRFLFRERFGQDFQL